MKSFSGSSLGISKQVPSASNFQPWKIQRKPHSSLRPRNSEAPQWAQNSSSSPTCPLLSGKTTDGVSNQTRFRARTENSRASFSLTLAFLSLYRFPDIASRLMSESALFKPVIFNRVEPLNLQASKEGQRIYSKAAGQLSNRQDVPRDHFSPNGIPKSRVKYWNGYIGATPGALG